MLPPVLIVKAGHQDLAGTLARGVNEVIIADIQADMGKRIAIGIKKNQIAGIKLMYRDWRQNLSHFARGARQGDALVFINMFDKTAAIEAFPRRGLAVAIRNTLQAQGIIDHRRQLRLRRPDGTDFRLMRTPDGQNGHHRQGKPDKKMQIV